jgi:hypothetical protein
MNIIHSCQNFPCDIHSWDNIITLKQWEKVLLSFNSLPFIQQWRPFSLFNYKQLHVFDFFILSYHTIWISPTYSLMNIWTLGIDFKKTLKSSDSLCRKSMSHNYWKYLWPCLYISSSFLELSGCFLWSTQWKGFYLHIPYFSTFPNIPLALDLIF